MTVGRVWLEAGGELLVQALYLALVFVNFVGVRGFVLLHQFLQMLYFLHKLVYLSFIIINNLILIPNQQIRLFHLHIIRMNLRFKVLFLLLQINNLLISLLYLLI
jgi:hypothetical protein